MGRSIDPMSEKTKTGSGPAAAPRLIVPMSLQRAIPRRVALQQSSPPLHRLGVTLNEKAQFEKQKPWNGKCASSTLSQLRGSVHLPVLPRAAPNRLWCHLISCLIGVTIGPWQTAKQTLPGIPPVKLPS